MHPSSGSLSAIRRMSKRDASVLKPNFNCIIAQKPCLSRSVKSTISSKVSINANRLHSNPLELFPTVGRIISLRIVLSEPCSAHVFFIDVVNVSRQECTNYPRRDGECSSPLSPTTQKDLSNTACQTKEKAQRCRLHSELSTLFVTAKSFHTCMHACLATEREGSSHLRNLVARLSLKPQGLRRPNST